MTRPIRVLQVLGRSAGGIARHVAQVVGSLDGTEEMTLDIAAPAGIPIAFPKQPNEVEIPDGIVGHRKATRGLRRAIGEGDYDVVHAHGLRATIDAGAAIRGTGAGAIGTIHNLVRPDVAGKVKAVLQRPAEPLAVRAVEHVLAVSEDIASHLRRVAPRHSDRIEMLHLGIGETPKPSLAPADVRRSLGVPEGGALITTVARLAPQKALDVLLRSHALLTGDATLVVLGEGPLESDLKRLASSLGIDARVHFLGFREDVVDHIAAADAFALSSSWEGVPLAAQEAIALGIPVVSTDVGGMAELVVEGHSGRLVPRGDVPGLARALQDVLDSPDEARRRAANALADLHKNFSTAHMLIRLTQLYRSIADANA